MKRMIAIGGAAFLAFPAAADTAFDNFGPGDSYNCCTGWTISGLQSVIGTDYDQGEQFTALADGTINFIDIAMGHVTGTNDFKVELFADAGGQPGSLISSWTGGAMQTFGATSDEPIHIPNSDPNAVLATGQNYWLIASVPNDTWAAFNWNSVGDVGGHAFRQNDGAWQISQDTRGAFRIDVSRVPGPGAAALLGLAGGRRRR